MARLSTAFELHETLGTAESLLEQATEITVGARVAILKQGHAAYLTEGVDIADLKDAKTLLDELKA
jgi:hypothetical protein